MSSRHHVILSHYPRHDAGVSSAFVFVYITINHAIIKLFNGPSITRRIFCINHWNPVFAKSSSSERQGRVAKCLSDQKIIRRRVFVREYLYLQKSKTNLNDLIVFFYTKIPCICVNFLGAGGSVCEALPNPSSVPLEKLSLRALPPFV